MRRWKALVAVGALLVGFGPTLAADDSDGEHFAWNWFGSLRARPEYNDNLSDLFAGEDDEISYANYRLNMGFEVMLDKDVSVLVDGQAYGVWGDNGGPALGSVTFGNSSDFMVYRAQIKAENIFGHPFSLTAGRQTLSFADEWLLGDADFYAGTAWDGIRGDWGIGDDLGKVSAFWAKGAELDRPEFGGDFNNDFDLYGIWTSWRPCDHSTLDISGIYWLDRRDFTGQGFSDKRFTLAGNWTYEPEDGGFYFVGNGAWQNGTTVSEFDSKEEIEAYAFELTPGWKWENDDRVTRLWARIAHYTGDDTDTDKVETFSVLTQDQHARYGVTDFWGGTFGHMAYVGGTPGLDMFQIGFSTETKVGIRLTGIASQMRRAEKISPGQDNRNLGQEVGVMAGYDYGKNLSLELGVGQIFAGTAFSYEPPLFGQANARRAWLSANVRF